MLIGGGDGGPCLILELVNIWKYSLNQGSPWHSLSTQIIKTHASLHGITVLSLTSVYMYNAALHSEKLPTGGKTGICWNMCIDTLPLCFLEFECTCTKLYYTLLLCYTYTCNIQM